MPIQIEKASLSTHFEPITQLVVALLEELGDEPVILDWEKIKSEMDTHKKDLHFFLAKAEKDYVAVLSLKESFALYTHGNYGIINELYVQPSFRSQNVGQKLIEAAISFGKAKDWYRIDVTAPLEEKWNRTRQFYLQRGFIPTGPKLKKILKETE